MPRTHITEADLLESVTPWNPKPSSENLKANSALMEELLYIQDCQDEGELKSNLSEALGEGGLQGFTDRIRQLLSQDLENGEQVEASCFRELIIEVAKKNYINRNSPYSSYSRDRSTILKRLEQIPQALNTSQLRDLCLNYLDTWLIEPRAGARRLADNIEQRLQTIKENTGEQKFLRLLAEDNLHNLPFNLLLTEYIKDTEQPKRTEDGYFFETSDQKLIPVYWLHNPAAEVYNAIVGSDTYKEMMEGGNQGSSGEQEREEAKAREEKEREREKNQQQAEETQEKEAKEEEQKIQERKQRVEQTLPDVSDPEEENKPKVGEREQQVQEYAGWLENLNRQQLNQHILHVLRQNEENPTCVLYAFVVPAHFQGEQHISQALQGSSLTESVYLEGSLQRTVSQLFDNDGNLYEYPAYNAQKILRVASHHQGVNLKRVYALYVVPESNKPPQQVTNLFWSSFDKQPIQLGQYFMQIRSLEEVNAHTISYHYIPEEFFFDKNKAWMVAELTRAPSDEEKNRFRWKLHFTTYGNESIQAEPEVGYNQSTEQPKVTLTIKHEETVKKLRVQGISKVNVVLLDNNQIYAQRSMEVQLRDHFSSFITQNEISIHSVTLSPQNPAYAPGEQIRADIKLDANWKLERLVNQEDTGVYINLNIGGYSLDHQPLYQLVRMEDFYVQRDVVIPESTQDGEYQLQAVIVNQQGEIHRQAVPIYVQQTQQGSPESEGTKPEQRGNPIQLQDIRVNGEPLLNQDGRPYILFNEKPKRVSISVKAQGAENSDMNNAQVGVYWGLPGKDKQPLSTLSLQERQFFTGNIDLSSLEWDERYYPQIELTLAGTQRDTLFRPAKFQLVLQRRPQDQPAGSGEGQQASQEGEGAQAGQSQQTTGSGTSRSDRPSVNEELEQLEKEEEEIVKLIKQEVNLEEKSEYRHLIETLQDRIPRIRQKLADVENNQTPLFEEGCELKDALALAKEILKQHPEKLDTIQQQEDTLREKIQRYANLENEHLMKLSKNVLPPGHALRYSDTKGKQFTKELVQYFTRQLQEISQTHKTHRNVGKELKKRLKHFIDILEHVKNTTPEQRATQAQQWLAGDGHIDSLDNLIGRWLQRHQMHETEIELHNEIVSFIEELIISESGSGEDAEEAKLKKELDKLKQEYERLNKDYPQQMGQAKRQQKKEGKQ